MSAPGGKKNRFSRGRKVPPMVAHTDASLMPPPHSPAPTQASVSPVTASPTPIDGLTDDVGVGKISYHGEIIPFTEADVETLEDIGEGNFGIVKKVRHKTRPILAAVKIMRDNIKPEERKSLIREISTIRKAQDCDFIVDYYGLHFAEGDVWVYMELMEVSLFHLYTRVKAAGDPVPEPILAQIAVSVLNGLCFLKDELGVMHRDIKPSNLLMGFDGAFKICDFGIAKNLEKSLLQSSIGCSPYLSPERINPQKVDEKYGVEADAWSFGLTLVELGKQRYPYDSVEDDRNIFSLLQAIVHGEAPKLPESYSVPFRHFVSQCLIKDKSLRPRYSQPPANGGQSLMEHEFYLAAKDTIDKAKVMEWWKPYKQEAPENPVAGWDRQMT